jgi:DNA-binding FadR family transcriptional regulator
VLAATHNDLIEQLGVVLLPALRLRDLVTFRSAHTDPASIKLHQAVLAAIEARRPEQAERRMHELLRQAAKDAERAARRPSSRLRPARVASR